MIAAEIVFIVPMMPSNMGRKQKQKQKGNLSERKNTSYKIEKKQTMGVMDWKLTDR